MQERGNSRLTLGNFRNRKTKRKESARGERGGSNQANLVPPALSGSTDKPYSSHCSRVIVLRNKSNRIETCEESEQSISRSWTSKQRFHVDTIRKATGVRLIHFEAQVSLSNSHLIRLGRFDFERARRRGGKGERRREMLRNCLVRENQTSKR